MYMAEQRKNRISILIYPIIHSETVGRFPPYCDSGTISLVSEPSPMALPSSYTKGRNDKNK